LGAQNAGVGFCVVDGMEDENLAVAAAAARVPPAVTDVPLSRPVMVHVGEPDRAQWLVLHVKSRQEKALAKDLATLDTSHYLPLVRQVRYYGKRKFQVSEPLFPGYLFLNGTIGQAYEAANRTDRVVGVLRVANQALLEWELNNIRAALAAGVGLLPHPTLKKGTRVEVRSGPLRGLQGLVEEHLKSDRLVLQVAMLGRATSLEIEPSLLEPIND
jgi:transcription antitermination factor NusG